jgi:hypothetical protein
MSTSDVAAGSTEKHVCAMGRCIRRRYSTCPAVCRARPGYVDPLKRKRP